jgi:hypothetical protein
MMFYSVRVFLWGIVAELEYHLYPWKTSNPPEWASKKYNLDHGIVDEHENHMYYDWLKSHEEKIGRLQKEVIFLLEKINE